MADWTPSPEQVEQAQVVAGGGLGALFNIYLRHLGTLMRAGAYLALGMGLALAFAEIAASWLGWPIVPVSVLIGLLGKPLAESALRAAEKIDLAAFFKPKGD